MNTRAAGIAAALLLAAAALYLSWATPPAQQQQRPKAEPDLFAFVRSMDGTRPDGDLKVASGEQLVVDAELGHLFDYYLAGLGEKDLAAIRAEIERELERRLKPGPALQARRLLAQYLDYKQALAGIEAGLPHAADLAQAAGARLQAMRQLRLHYFTAEESAGLFGSSDAYDEDTLARLAIGQDTQLSEAGKRDKLAALDQRMPAALRAEREAPLKVARLEESVQQLRAQGAGDNEIYRLRASAISPAAAARLADLDREEAAWNSRIDAYVAQRNKLMGQPDGQNEAALQQLRDASFNADEQRRLGAYE
ncbi:lipase secretion chaperone [Janthinobacterium agaricidamnosum]|uniref:Lipase helper protein n=1 Tax=Janthinobacterium agaricidamnosum NBRC 102515 = DSM 9628 TaxID=1349767 RepID=W0V4I3_9BURK|nr:lipase secretion chaperone [Janthinobacterium agaricidamnosum]CDG82791.1 proteobacterial lipase chaperone family protein [Janthinobacterium agaricidamnosum NBRC 102515 = DSM 9628]